MKYAAGAAAMAIALSSTANAGGLDRSGQSVQALFDDPGTFGLSLGYVKPSLTGQDIGTTTGDYDAGGSYVPFSLSFSNEINDKFSYGVIFDQPFGADIFYNGNPTQTALGGTGADLSSKALSVLGKYRATERVSVFGGLRFEEAGGTVSLNGTAFGAALGVSAVAQQVGTTEEILGGALAGDADAIAALPAGVAANLATLGGQVQTLAAGFVVNGGYSVDLEQDWGVGYTAGLSYEVPEIALRAVLTYHSEIKHNSASTERLAVGPLTGQVLSTTTNFKSPRSINLEFQTGVAEDTLLMAGVRWTNWGKFDVIPPTLNSDLANLDDVYRWNLGLARRFNDRFAGSISLTYEKDQGSANVSPLGPTDGQIGLTVGGRYSQGNLDISGGVNYTMMGDTFAGVGGANVASFEGNKAVGVGLKLNYKF